MKKRILCALLTAVSVISGSAAGIMAGAFGGGYPEHSVTNPPIKEQDSSVMNCWTESNADYVFTVGGKKFVLLDRDSEGNYFVIAEEEYGKYPYSTAYDGSQTIETRIEDGGGVTYVPGAAHDMIYDNWKFDTENTASIGYWLNHEFFENGNGGSYKLPEEIKKNIIEKEWPVEGYKPVLSWTASQNYENVNNVKHAEQFAEICYQGGYTVNGKLSLMSFTEYMHYQDLIGWMYCSADWDGFMLRTPHALITASDATRLVYKFGSVQVRNQSTNVDTSKKMLIAGNDAPSKPLFYVRPVMWLSKNFFTSAPIELESAGTMVKEEIVKNSMAELSMIYTDKQLEALGFDVENAPKTEHQSVAGTPAAGAVLYAKYGYVSPTGAGEAGSSIEWYISDSADGEYAPLGVSGAFIKTDDSMNGKYIKYRIMPKDKNENAGKYFWSEPASAVKSMNIPMVNGISVTDANMAVTLKNLDTAPRNVNVIKAVYDTKNQLISVSSSDPVTLEAGAESTQNIDISEKAGGNRVTVMVWIENSQPVFYMSV